MARTSRYYQHTLRCQDCGQETQTTSLEPEQRTALYYWCQRCRVTSRLHDVVASERREVAR